MSGVTDIEYVQVAPADLDEVEDLLDTEFFLRANLRKGVGEDGSTPRTGKQSEKVRQCLASGVSVGARDKATSSLVGVMTCYIVTRDSNMKMLQEEPEYSSGTERKTLELIKRVKELFDPFQDPDVDRVLELDLLCVHTEYCRRGIAGKMVEMSMDLAAKKGYQVAITEVTSLYSEKLFLRLGFQIQAELDLTKHQDVLDLSLMDHILLKVMTKHHGVTFPPGRQ